MKKIVNDKWQQSPYYNTWESSIFSTLKINNRLKFLVELWTQHQKFVSISCVSDIQFMKLDHSIITSLWTTVYFNQAMGYLKKRNIGLLCLQQPENQGFLLLFFRLIPYNSCHKKKQWHESRADQHKEQISYIAQENNTIQNVWFLITCIVIWITSTSFCYFQYQW